MTSKHRCPSSDSANAVRYWHGGGPRTVELSTLIFKTTSPTASAFVCAFVTETLKHIGCSP